MSDLGWKVNLDFWNLFIAIVSLGLTYQVGIVTFALTVLTFQKYAFGSKFDLGIM